jgi:hypothetical protein
MKAKNILHCAAIALFFSGCFGNAKNSNISSTETVSPKTKTFYRILRDKVFTCQEFKIIDNEIVLNYLDMEWYGYHISAMDNQGDSIMRMSIDKEVDILEYDKGNLKLYGSDLPNSPKNILLRKNNQTHQWDIYMDDALYKYTIIDSLDLQKSGYAVDTVNYWLEE